ncbi:hydroxyphenylacetyl-CoA thioesterase PaaI [Bradyrhizobium erythrophlei]|uniref:hydroxyphenylacetyl-CoA thioesterase PaaI n=1 Tax=Bradyrhizobium erythrophlei TaxID=1437360 RepID=UPI0035EB453B
MTPLPDDPCRLAEQCAAVMLAGDAPARAFGFSLRKVAPGEAELEMTVSESSLNAFGTCHGGALFTLADTALSIACNSYGRQSVAQQCSITFVRPVRLGDHLIARAFERCRTSRTAIYDCTLTNARDGKVIAEFRGHSRTIADAMPTPI